MDEIPCGRIGIQTPRECAERAAEAIASARIKMAVCLAPRGHVTVEAIEQAIFAEMVDVYSPGNQLALWRQIETDIAAACKERDIRGGSRQLQRVKGRTRRAA